MKRSFASTQTAPSLSDTIEFTIGDLAAFYGVSLRTLRFYEDRGLMRPRRQGTARFYSAMDRVRLELILKGKRLGFSLSEIHELIASRATPVAAENPTADLVVNLNSAQVATQIAHLERQRDELNSAIEELREAHQRMCETVG